uniref:Uncharacterized protein n=1 Tax=Pararge aegeria TaxID=116150 RepID=S4NWW2_9NEOP
MHKKGNRYRGVQTDCQACQNKTKTQTNKKKNMSTLYIRCVDHKKLWWNKVTILYGRRGIEMYVRRFPKV